VRFAPSNTNAIASIRRADRESLVLPAAARSSTTVKSFRVILIVIQTFLPATAVMQKFDQLGIPFEAITLAVGIT